jgi:uncharacterized glyoxalase superfamily protein PhnB
METKIILESLSPNLISDDVNKSVKFYTDILGFTKIASVPETGKYDWVMLVRDGVTMMFQSLGSLQTDLPNLKITAKGSLGTFYIKVKGLDQLFDAVNGKAEVVVPMRTTFYNAREFAIKDPDGYFLMFAEDVR